MKLATVDPDVPKHFKELQEFRVAFFDMLENISSFAELDMNLSDVVRTYHPEGAIVSVMRSEPPNGSILPGDYFIVVAPGLELMWRISVTQLELGDTVNDSTFAMHPDPFGEITRTYRAEYFANFVEQDEETIEAPDVDLTDYFVSRRELVDA